eukprot:2032551-Prymnesium_polylepis.1
MSSRCVARAFGHIEEDSPRGGQLRKLRDIVVSNTAMSIIRERCSTEGSMRVAWSLLCKAVKHKKCDGYLCETRRHTQLRYSLTDA